MIRISLILGMASFFSCKKEVVPNSPPYIEQWWDKYYGTYQVFDTINDTTYEMKILQIERKFENNVFIDSFKIENLGNSFDVYHTTSAVASSAFSAGVQSPIKDHNGNSWVLLSSNYWNNSKDTLKIFYSISNQAYWNTDGIPFYQCYCTDLGIKVE